MKIKFDILSIAMVVLTITGISPVFLLLGIRGVLIQGLIYMFIVINNKKFGLNKYTLSVIVLMLLSLFISALYWNNIYVVKAHYFLILSLLVVNMLNDKSIDKYVDYITYITIILIIMAWIAIIYAFIGGKSIMSFDNGFGREYFLYVTSLVAIESISGNIVRPTGIFDEPGSFSFIICYIAILRSVFKKNEWITFYMLLGGFVTLSIAHFVFFLIYLISLNMSKRNVIYILIMVVFALIIYNSSFSNVFDSKFIGRFQYVEGVGFVGDNRTLPLLKSWDYLKSSLWVFIYGMDLDFIINRSEVIEYYDNVGENILTPIVEKGLLLSWPFYLLMLQLIVFGLKKKEYILFFGYATLLYQRPFLFHYSYSFMSCMIFIMMYYKNNNINYTFIGNGLKKIKYKLMGTSQMSEAL